MARSANRIQITSWEGLQERIQSVLERVNADPALALAAAVNPLHALEELGFDIEPSVRPAIEERLRFKPRTSARLQNLRQEIHRHAGREFDIDSPGEVQVILFDRLAIKRPAASDEAPNSAATPTENNTAQPASKRPMQSPNAHALGSPDPLETLRGAHPIIEPLLEYRKLQASAPHLAPRALYDEVRRGGRRLGVMNVRARPKTRSP
jgi:hypothetical protein